MSDISKLVSAEENVIFIVNGVEQSLSIKELSIRERENYNTKLISEARTSHIRKLNEIATSLAGKDKTDYLVAATNSMPDFEEQLGTLIFSNNGIRHLLKASICRTITDKEIDSILDDASNGDSISKVIKKALKLGDIQVIEKEVTESPNV